MGIEPTQPASRRTATGFEVQADHQAGFTSEPCDCNRNRRVSNVKLQIILRYSDNAPVYERQSWMYWKISDWITYKY
jgi:hypothetical protein